MNGHFWVKFFLLIFLETFISSCSCTSREKEVVGPLEMWEKIQKVEPQAELVFLADTVENQQKRVLCSQYLGEGCIPGSGRRIKVRLVELLAIQYETRKQACVAARAIGQWYAFNWLFDDVTHEPVLEDFVTKVFQAQKPSKDFKCR